MFLLDYAGPAGFAAAVARALPAGRAVLLDHHKTAAEHLEGADLPGNLHIGIDQRRSGAVLALDHFQPKVRRLHHEAAWSDTLSRAGSDAGAGLERPGVREAWRGCMRSFAWVNWPRERGAAHAVRAAEVATRPDDLRPCISQPWPI